MFCLSIFSACTPPMYDLKYDDLKNEILSVELINYNSEKKRADKRTAIMNYNFNYETVIETISQENLQSFLGFIVAIIVVIPFLIVDMILL